ncbi:MAG: hypothetical protein AB3N16_15135 [Flavobacteriaceae bacterium]
MLHELEEFTQQHQNSRIDLENNFIVASDDELAKEYKDVVNDGDSCTLVSVIPTHDADIGDEDNRRLQNNLYFMVIKKTDGKAGPEKRLEIFKKCQIEIKALLVKIVGLHENFSEDCVFRNIDLNSFRIDPVQDYLGANGFQIEFSTRTLF